MATHSQSNCHRVDGAGEFYAAHGYLEVPHLVQWMATLRCGLSCEHCLASGDKAGLGDMPLGKVKSLIDEVSHLGVAEFLITGGEPLVRTDLPEVIAYLGHRQVNWTLNSAAFPNETLRKAISQSPPGFVAVSLDGPKAVHNAFRGKASAYDEAMASIEFYKSLKNVRVCAGTTVTSRNYDYLDETFHLVVGSGADQWGIHMLVPEGRAAERQDLFLQRAQLKRLLKFVARKRQVFNVHMADEIGYLGMYEPLVREIPLTCGAGRSQCVVLPDGSVMPCTTLDRSASAGNINESSLMEIWTHGFNDLRTWRAQGKCKACDYSMACKGGCWLQRKAGKECFKDVWYVPGALKTAAGIAICFAALGGQNGGALLEQSAMAAEPGDVVPTAQVDADQDVTALEDAINQWYFDQVRVSTELPGFETYIPKDANDPGWQFFSDVLQGTLPSELPDRCTSVNQALDTQQKSLSLAALCWRAVNEPLLDPNAVMPTSVSDRAVLHDTIFRISEKAAHWRMEIYDNTLDAYLANGRYVALPVCSSSGGKSRGPTTPTGLSLQKDLNIERWGIGGDYDCMSAAKTYLIDHPYGEPLQLVFSFFTRGSLIKTTAYGSEEIHSHTEDYCSVDHSISIFDVIETTEDVMLYFKIQGAGRTSCGSDSWDDQLFSDAAREYVFTSIPVFLNAGRQYTYSELLQVIYQDNRDVLLELAEAWLNRWGFQVTPNSGYSIDGIFRNGPLMWPALREIVLDDSVTYTRRFSPNNNSYTMPSDTTSMVFQRAVLKDIDFWMF